MTTREVYQTIVHEKPLMIYVSGKSSTGKSTFGRLLRDELGYQVVELEAILLEMTRRSSLDEQATFHKVFYEAADSKEKTLFLEATDKIIARALAQHLPTVIEGAVANTETLQRILRPAADLFFLYFHPADLNVYIRNLTQRFMESGEGSYAGLSRTFWQGIDADEFKEFCRTRLLSEGIKEAIRHYAIVSQKESLRRFDEVRRRFGPVTLVEIA